MTKDLVLSALINAKDPLSGERISRELGVSRTAVNRAVGALRQEGYVIGSSTKTGYTLTHSPDRLRAGELIARLGAARGESIICLDSVDSTNDHLKSLAQGGAAAGTVVLANAQTAGRGRLGKSFRSPADEGVYLSMLLRPGCTGAELCQLTARVAVAICAALESLGVEAGIKWVNDLVLNRRKLGGILTELEVEGESGRVAYAVVGVGINVGQSSFPPELSDIATSLLMETGAPLSRCALAAAMIGALDTMAGELSGNSEKYLREYRRLCVTLGREVTFISDGQRLSARAEGIDEDFGLIVRYSNGKTEILRSGDVSVRGLYGYI